MTPAIKLLESQKIRFTLHTYAHDEAAEQFGLEAAEKLGVPAERVFKTLVAQTDENKLVFAIVPSAARLNLKQLAAAVGAKRAALADPKLAEKTTGYVVGGISPLGGKKQLATVVDASANGHATIFVSAGRRGLQVELMPADLVRLTRAVLAAITGI